MPRTRAVDYRYPDDPKMAMRDREPYSYPYNYDLSHICTSRGLKRAHAIAQAAKSIHCYRYQACEHPDWPTSLACAFVEAVERPLLRAVPGYEMAE